jgi:glycerol-3-phosphate acyltransferase PlsY
MNYLISYLIGSLLFSPILAKIFKSGDLSKKGSGNLGATNLARVSGKKWLGILAAILDGGKVALALILAKNFEEEIIYGSLVIIGHLFPLWRPLGGGKGIASFLGLALLIKPLLGLLLLIIWAGTFAITKTSSLSSLVMVFASLFFYPFFLSIKSIFPIFLIILLIIFKHRQNIKNLIAGKEKKL